MIFMIEVKNLTKKYGNHTAVDHLTFTVEDGIIYGFLGPNGAGKSTTMNMMTGYLAATEGSVSINGYDILNDTTEAKKQIGYLPELPPLYQDMTVMEYLDFVCNLKKISKADKAADISDAIQKTMLSDVQNRLIKNLSKGYKQRVGLAQSLLGNPSVIILDEPSVGLDPKQIIEIREVIKGLKGEHTVILSSHILSEISAVCDKIMIINKGKLVALDTPEGLQKYVGNKKCLELETNGDSEMVQNILSEIGGINVDAVTNSEREGLLKVSVSFDGDTDPSQNIFFAFAQHSLPIVSMNVKEVSLEDIFIELTDNDAQGGME